MNESHLNVSPCILVTGANGFLGSEIIRKGLVSNILMRTTDKNPKSIEPRIEYYPSDILDLPSIKPALRGITCVIHAAGLAHIFGKTQDATALFRAINEQGTLNVARAAAELDVQHFILISSVSVYGSSAQRVYSEDTLCCPLGPYAESKYHAELGAREIARKSGMALTILRLATIYGEGDPGNVSRLMRALDRGRFIWIGDGSNRKSMLYKGDAARACLTVAARPETGVGVYNVSAPPCSMRDIVDGLATALGKKPLAVRIPAPMALAAGKLVSLLPEKRLSHLYSTLKTWLATDVYDTSRIEREYEFHTQVDLLEGLKREVCWYQKTKTSKINRNLATID